MEDRLEIRRLYETGKYSQRKLAGMYGVSRRLITFYIDPDKLKEARARYKERQAEGRYYDKESRREYMRKHRKYKRQLMEEGKLVTDPSKVYTED